MQNKSVTADKTTPLPNNATIVGLKPWFPPPLSRSTWWTQPVRAERLAALRIGISLVLMVDVVLTYLPNASDFFGGGGLGGPEIFGYLWDPPQGRLNWSLFQRVESSTFLFGGMIVWLAAIAGLLVGWFTRVNAVLVWVLSTSFANLNPYIDNAGDQVRGIILFYLMLCPCGAVWSVDAWLKRRGTPAKGPVFVYPWALRLLFLQLVFIYFCNGLAKLPGIDWIRGDSLYYVLGDLALTRFSYVQLPIPMFVLRLATWTVLVWELGFPVWVISPYSRPIALWIGVLFHLGIWLLLELGGFAPYMLCLYLPLVPWERLSARRITEPIESTGQD